MSCPFLWQKDCVARMNSRRGGRKDRPYRNDFRRIGRHKRPLASVNASGGMLWRANPDVRSRGARRRASGGARRRVLGCSVTGVSEPRRSGKGRKNMRAEARYIDRVRVSSRAAIGGPDHLAASSSAAAIRCGRIRGASTSVPNWPRSAFFALLDVPFFSLPRCTTMFQTETSYI